MNVTQGISILSYRTRFCSDLSSASAFSMTSRILLYSSVDISLDCLDLSELVVLCDQPKWSLKCKKFAIPPLEARNEIGNRKEY